MNEIILIHWDELGVVMLNAVLIYFSIIGITRLSGLRTYSKMTTFDFAITVAIGSVVASGILLSDIGYIKTLVTLGSLVFLQWVVSMLVSRVKLVENIVTNKPVLLVKDGTVLTDNLTRVRMSHDELYAKLRMAGVHSVTQVVVATLETTADVSVIKKVPGVDFDSDMLRGVADESGTSEMEGESSLRK
jgi:uncharacterized membrane protein YcaP (DUF421 family)